MAVNIAAPGTRASTATRQALLSDPNTAWGTHSGTYTVPLGQTTTRFGFQAVSSAGANASVGNFLDSISFGTQPCLVTTTTVSLPAGRTTAQVGDVLTYTVTTANNGGNPAREVVMTDDLPAGVEFVPGSIVAVTGTATTTRTDAAGDDQGEFVAPAGTGTGTVRVRVGTAATSTAGGVVGAGDARSFSYQARVLPVLSGQTLRNDARVAYRDELTVTTPTSTSNEVATPVGVAADLRATLTQDTTPLVAGRTASWTATLTDRGPGTEPAPVLTTTIPAALTGVTATPVGGGSCTVSGTTVTCTGPALASGAARSVTVTGTVPADATPGVQYTVLSSVRGDAHDAGPTDNTATVSGAVTALADVSVTLTSDPATGVAGGLVRYTAVVTNDGPSTARGVRLVDPLRATSAFQSATVAGGMCSLDGASNTVTCALPDLAPGTSLPVVVTARLAPGGDGSVDNAVSVAATTPDRDADDLTASVRGAGGQEADLSVTLTLDDTDLLPGETLGFTVTVRNDGPSDATNVSVRSTLPPGVVILSTNTAGCVPGNCSIPLVGGSGGTVVITGTARVGADAPEGTLLASATVVSAVPDVDGADQSATVSATIRLSADLGVTLALSDPADPGNPAPVLVAGSLVHGLATVTNNGPTRASGVQLRLATLAGAPVPTVVPSAGGCGYQGATTADGRAVDGGVVVCWLDQLATGAVWTVASDGLVPATYTGSTFTRSRTVTSTSPDPAPDNDTGSATLSVVRRADLQVVKTTSTPSVVQTGTVRFQVTVRNAGPSDARDVVVREQPQPGVVVTGASPSAGSYGDATGVWRVPYLAVGGSAVLDVTGTAESPDDVENRAAAAGSDATDPQPGNDVGAVQVDVLPAARTLTVTAQATVAPAVDQGGARVGDAVDLGYVVRNDGNVRMSGIRVDETLVPGAVACPHDSLAPGEQMTCTAGSTYRVTQADVDAGTPVTSSATAFGRAPDSTTDLVFGPATTSLPMAAGAPGVGLTLVANWDDADADDALDVGETATWTAVVTNSGDLTVRGLTVSAPRVPAFTCADTELAPGAWTSCATATTPLTQGDVDGGQRSATATATGTEARTGAVVQSAPSATAFPAVLAPALQMTLGGVVTPPAHQDAAALGDQVTWRYTVTNTGNVELTGVAVDDPDAGPATCALTVLQPGRTTVCTSDTPRAVTEADVLAGGVTGRATATGSPVVGGDQVRSPQGQTVVRVAGAVRSLQITARALTATLPVRAGDTIDYEYTVANDGNVTMRLVQVADELVGPARCGQDVLAPGETTTCSGGGSHRVSQVEFDAGRPIADLAQVSGVPTGASTELTFGPASAPVAVAAAAPGLAVLGVADWADADADDVLDADETVDWWALVTNPGDVTVTGITVTSTRGDVLTCPVPALGPGEQMRCTAPRHTLTTTDVAGPVQADLRVAGVEPRALTAVEGLDSVTVSGTERLALLLTVGQAVAGSPTPDVGDGVRRLFTVTNAGNTTVDTPSVTSDDGEPVTCPAGALAPGASTVCRGDGVHTVTEADVRAGKLVTGGTASAPALVSRTAVSSTHVTQALFLAPLLRALQVTATPLPSAPAPLAVGDRVDYRYVVRNVGNATMTALALVDSAGGTATCAAPSLAPGAETTCTGGSSHEVTQPDFDAGLPVGLTAEVTGLADGDLDPLAFGPAAAPLPLRTSTPALTAVKTADWTDDGNGALDAGEPISWTVAVRNTGDVTVADLYVDDPLVHVQCPQTSVGPGQQVDCVADAYRVTDADALAGERTNTAVALGDDPRTGSPVVSLPALAYAVGTPVAAPALAIAVDGVVTPTQRQSAAEWGDTVHWRYTVTNTGGVAVLAPAVVDHVDGPVVCPSTALAPGQQVSCQGVVPHLVAEVDVLAAAVRTQAHAEGLTVDPAAASPAAAEAAPAARVAAAASRVVSSPADGVVATAAARPGLTLAQRMENTTARDTAPRRDDLVDLVYRVTNTGNVTLTGIAISDPFFGTVACPQPALGPTESMDCRTAQPHRVDATDVGAGELVSEARAAGTPPTGSGTATASTVSTVSMPVAASAGGPITGGPVTDGPVTDDPGTGGGAPDGGATDEEDGGAAGGGVPSGSQPPSAAPVDVPAETSPAPVPTATPGTPPTATQALAATGTDTGAQFVLGVLSVLLGALLLVLARRRVVSRRW
nr:hypothetical protein [Modestobacter muralis]